MAKEADIVDRLQSWITDWNGDLMVPGEPPRDGIHCDVLYEAIDEIKCLRRASPTPPDAGVKVKVKALVEEWGNDWRQCGCTDAGCFGRHEERNAVLDDVTETLLPAVLSALARVTGEGKSRFAVTAPSGAHVGLWDNEETARSVSSEMGRGSKVTRLVEPSSTSPDREALEAIRDARLAEGEDDDREGYAELVERMREIARAAACYAWSGSGDHAFKSLCTQETRWFDPASIRRVWPWDDEWWKPKDRRRDLVRAGALILAEIERLDRAALRGGS